jgi:hypothetical protein
MSLNRCEQRIFDYFQVQVDERQYWIQKVQKTAKAISYEHAAAAQLEKELWAYYVERAGVASPFREATRTEGLQRTSMRNLAELLLRLWAEPKPKKGPSAPPTS